MCCIYLVVSGQWSAVSGPTMFTMFTVFTMCTKFTMWYGKHKVYVRVGTHAYFVFTQGKHEVNNVYQSVNMFTTKYINNPIQR